VTEATDFSSDGKENDKRRDSRRPKSRQLAVIFALLTAFTALVITIGFIVFTTGKRFQSSELLPVIGGAIVVSLVFATFLQLVNDGPSPLIRVLRLVLLPHVAQNQKSSLAVPRQQYVRHIKRLMQRVTNAEAKALDIEYLLRRSLTRLEAEISEVRRRGGINLAMGMSITLVGLGILGYAVYAAPSLQATPVELAMYFLPRLSLALVTEMFAYFFLRLYKHSMTETKYFQNELTGAEARALSILMASKHEAPALIASVAKSLAALDRNHVLEKGQTTVEIEQARIESDSMRGLAGGMSGPPWRRRAKKREPVE